MKATLRNYKHYAPHVFSEAEKQLASLLHSVVDEVSRDKYDGNLYLADTDGHDFSFWDVHVSSRAATFTFRLRTHDYDRPGWRYSWSGRRMKWASWEAHRDVLVALFDYFGDDLTVRTSMATYKGKQGFEDNYEATAARNVGSVMQPATMPELTGDVRREVKHVQ